MHVVNLISMHTLVPTLTMIFKLLQVQPLPQQRMPKVNVFFWVSKHILPILLLIILAVMSIYYSDDLFANSDIYKFKGVYGDFPILKFFYNTAVTVATAGFVYIYFT